LQKSCFLPNTPKPTHHPTKNDVEMLLINTWGLFFKIHQDILYLDIICPDKNNYGAERNIW
jgi:hypothetical protein